MKLKKGFITRTVGDEQIMVGVGRARFNGMVSSNETAAFIVDQLKQETTPSQIVDAILEVYDAPRVVVERDVAGILNQLRSIHAIEE